MKIIKLKPLFHASAVILTLLTALTMVNTAAAVPHTPAGSIIQNQVVATYKDSVGNSYSNASNVVKITIREVNSATLTNTSGETQTVADTPNALVYSVHTLHNTGNTTDTYTLSAVNETTGDTLEASEILIYLDTNGNGQLDDDEKTPITTIELVSDESVKLIVVSKLPATLSDSDTLNIKVNAVSQKGGGVDGSNLVKINFTNAQPKIDVALTAAKDIDCDGNHEGSFGDINLVQMAPTECVIMNIQAENSSATTALEVVLKDPIPAFTTFKTGTLQYCKGDACTLENFTDSVDSDNAEYDKTNGEVKFKAGTIIAGEKASARFSIVID
jgi:hypothetical protein